MTSPLNSWLLRQEQRTPVPKHARAALRTELFGTPSFWRRFAPLFVVSSLGAAALIVSFTLPAQTVLTPESVLAAASIPGSLSSGTIESITVTSTFSDGTVRSGPAILTDGTHFLVFMEGEEVRWLEKNPDDLTMTQYRKTEDGIERWLVGDQMHLDESRTDIDGWQMDPVNNLLGMNYGPGQGPVTEFQPCSDCGSFTLPSRFEGGNITMTSELQNGEEVYRVISEGTPPDTQPLSSQTATESITRTAIIRSSDFRLLATSWDAKMADGKEVTGGTAYSYETLSPEELGHPFTLAWWLSSVDPEAIATVYCRAYSSASCADAPQKTETHEPLYLPEGWLEEPALGDRKQILTIE